MDLGNSKRTVASTLMNDCSSRSHSILMLHVKQFETHSGMSITTEKSSKLSMVDLAGSERVKKSGLENDRLKEGTNINKSLSTLGLVIKALKEKSRFIPFRDSTLTWYGVSLTTGF